MNFYRIAYRKLKPLQERTRCTFIEEDGRTAQQWAGRYCQSLNAELLSLQEGRLAHINNELELKS